MEFQGCYGKYDIMLEGLYSNKFGELEKSLDMIVGLIHDRLSIKEKNVYRIEKELMNARNIALNLIPNNYSWLSDQMNGLRISFERDIIGMEREKRQENTSAWRDIVLLKNDLVSLMKDLGRMKTRMSLVESLEKEGEGEKSDVSKTI